MNHTNNKNLDQHNRKKNSILMIITAVVVIVCVVLALVSGQNKDNTLGEDSQAAVQESEPDGKKVEMEEPDREEEEVENSTETVIAEGEALIIPIADVTEEASFYTVEVDGTQMEVIAVRDSDGNIRTAFNTCQVCYSSGRGYYEQQGDVLVCQNCGSQFAADQVEIESGGCNPWPIMEEDKIVTDDSVEISYDFLKASRDIFDNWKTTY